MELLSGRVARFGENGAGVVDHDGRIYFIDGVLPGEAIEFEARKKRRGKFIGVVKNIIEPSASRVEPRCRYFGVCGGCVHQHLDHAAQLACKEKFLFDQLAKLGKQVKQDPPQKIQKIAGITAAPWHYRRRARIGVRYVAKKGGILVGFRERNSGYITSLHSCEVLDARLSALLSPLHELLGQISCADAIPQIEMAAADNALALVLRHLRALSDADLALLKQFAECHALQLFLQPGGLDSIAPLSPCAPMDLTYRLDEYDITLQFSATDFIQVNAAVNAAMIKKVLALLQPAGDSVLDLFCGLGNFTLPLARLAARVVGVEGDAGLTARARKNAALNQLHNAEFVDIDLHNSIESLDALCAGARFEKMLLDPPRSGAEQVAQRIPKLRPQVAVYVSCNPTTLARDAAHLLRGGYRITHAGVIDMFPHTARIEAVARFECD